LGKYSHLKDQLTKFSGEVEYQDRVNAEKDRIKTLLLEDGKSINPSNLGDVLVEARQEKDRLEGLVKVENLTIAAMEQMLVEQMEASDYASLKLANGISLSIKDDVYCQVGNKKLFYDWIEETGQQALLTVNYQTMASMTKTSLIDGKPIPPGINTYFKQGITVRGAKLKNGGSEEEY
jgi:hypothetical protein